MTDPVPEVIDIFEATAEEEAAIDPDIVEAVTSMELSSAGQERALSQVLQRRRDRGDTDVLAQLYEETNP